MKIRLRLETDMKKLFESTKKVANIGAPDAQIVLLKAPYLQFEQFLFAKNYRQYLEIILFPSKILQRAYKKLHT